MFGAWQAGVWRALEKELQPDLIVGASVGSLNGYAIASGWSAKELCELWTNPDVASFRNLPKIAEQLVNRQPLSLQFSVVLVDVLRMKPRTFTGAQVTARHLVASCAVPVMVPPQKIDGQWYVDGGLLNPLPVWAAVEGQATRIFAVNALPRIPSNVLQPMAQGFRWAFGYRPPLPAGVELFTLEPSIELGDLRAAVQWNLSNSQRWIEQGMQDARKGILQAKNILG